VIVWTILFIFFVVVSLRSCVHMMLLVVNVEVAGSGRDL
jgi:hypothetical protein